MTNITSPTSDDPVPAFTDPKRPDYSRLAGSAQSPIMQEGGGYIKELGDTGTTSLFNSIPAGAVSVPALSFVTSGSYRRVATLTLKGFSGRGFFPYFTNSAQTSGIPFFRLSMNNIPVTDWISLVSVWIEPQVFGKPTSPFAGPDTSFVGPIQPQALPPPRAARIYYVNFDTVELCADFAACLVAAQIISGNANIAI